MFRWSKRDYTVGQATNILHACINTICLCASDCKKKHTHTAVYICEQISKISFPRKKYIYKHSYIYIYFAFIVDVAAGCAPSPVPPPPQSLSSALIYLTDANELMQTMHAHIPRIFYSKEAPTRSAVAESTIYSNKKKT